MVKTLGTPAVMVAVTDRSVFSSLIPGILLAAEESGLHFAAHLQLAACSWTERKQEQGLEI